MPATRKCAQCGEPTLEPQECKMEIYNSVYAYKCSNCQHEVELEPYGSLGFQITLGLLFVPVVWFLFMDDHGDWPSWSNMPTLIETLILLAIVLFFPMLTFFEMRKHARYPLVDSDGPREHFDLAPSKAITKAPVMWIEKFGILGGMLAPILIIIVVLGLAVLLGYINFTFFNDNLFG